MREQHYGTYNMQDKFTNIVSTVVTVIQAFFCTRLTYYPRQTQLLKRLTELGAERVELSPFWRCLTKQRFSYELKEIEGGSAETRQSRTNDYRAGTVQQVIIMAALTKKWGMAGQIIDKLDGLEVVLVKSLRHILMKGVNVG